MSFDTCTCSCVCVRVCALCLSICYLNALHFWLPLDATPRRPHMSSCQFSPRVLTAFFADHRMWISASTSTSISSADTLSESAAISCQVATPVTQRCSEQTCCCGLKLESISFSSCILNLDKLIYCFTFHEQLLLFYQPNASLTLTTLAMAQVSNCLELISTSSHASQSNQSQFPLTFHTLFPNALAGQTLWRPADAVKFNKNH